MKLLPFFSLVLFSFSNFPLPLTAAEEGEKSGEKSRPEFDVAKASREIDSLVEVALTKQGAAPNADIDDATFVRRIYLDIAGRVPTIEEAENFHGSTYPRKREQLITDLSESDGQMSHLYNFWADVLRINSALGTGATQAEAAYQLWVKDAIEKNIPYDQFVRDLITARGMIWENGAIRVWSYRSKYLPERRDAALVLGHSPHRDSNPLG